MRRWILRLFITCIVSTSLCGCAGRQLATKELERNKSEVKDVVDNFLLAVARSDYRGLINLVTPADRADFDPQAFVTRTFSMKPTEFRITSWDGESMGITTVESTGEMLSLTVVIVKMPSQKKPKKIYINLYCQRSSDKWWINPYPEK